MDYTKLSVGQIRDDLVNNYGMLREVADAIKGKSELVKAHMDISGNSDTSSIASVISSVQDLPDDEPLVDVSELENLKPESDFSNKENCGENTIPLRYSIGWSDYILSLFSPDELISTPEGKRFPTADSLRRVCREIMGEFSIEVNVIKYPTKDDYSAVVQATIILMNGQVFSDVAGSSPQNTDSPYDIFPCETALTKAEGRVYRKVLGLKKMLALEEVSVKAMLVNENEWSGDDSANSSQLNVIRKLCRDMDISFELFINSGEKK